MRAMVVILALTLALPAAAAASATLTLTPPEGAVPSGSTVPVRVRLELRDFWCSQPREVAVEAMVRGSGASASLPNGSLRFMTDAQPHFGQAYVLEGELPVAVQALGASEGTVELVASVAPPADCFTPDGFVTASANATLRVTPAPAAPEPATTPPAPGNGTAAEGNETADANETETVDGNDTQESVGGDGRQPPGMGPIGDYQPPASNDNVPGLGLAALLAVGAASALVLRRKR